MIMGGEFLDQLSDC